MSKAEISHSIQTSALFTAVRQSEIFYPTVLATHLTCIAIFGGSRKCDRFPVDLETLRLRAHDQLRDSARGIFFGADRHPRIGFSAGLLLQCS